VLVLQELPIDAESRQNFQPAVARPIDGVHAVAAFA
jgi:hypothetical protein